MQTQCQFEPGHNGNLIWMGVNLGENKIPRLDSPVFLFPHTSGE
jgi:hypothetical protein